MGISNPKTQEILDSQKLKQSSREIDILDAPPIKDIAKEEPNPKNNSDIEGINFEKPQKYEGNINLPKENDNIRVEQNQPKKHHPLTDFGNDEDDKEQDNKPQIPKIKRQDESSQIKIEEKQNNTMEQNYQIDDLELSQSVYYAGGDISELKKQSVQYIKQGYFPLFIKLNNYKPICFFIRGTSTLKSLVKMYLRYLPETDQGLEKDIQLYIKGAPLDNNKQINNLNLEYFSIITNKKEENNIEKNYLG